MDNCPPPRRFYWRAGLSPVTSPYDRVRRTTVAPRHASSLLRGSRTQPCENKSFRNIPQTLLLASTDLRLACRIRASPGGPIDVISVFPGPLPVNCTPLKVQRIGQQNHYVVGAGGVGSAPWIVAMLDFTVASSLFMAVKRACAPT